jgi:hypothetical protein
MEAHVVVFSPDGRTLVSGHRDHTVQLWDVALGKEIRTWQGTTDGPASIAFAPDGRTVASASDQTILIWDVTGLLHEGKLAAQHLGIRDLERLWGTLAGDDSPAAHAAGWQMVAAPSEVVPFLAERLRPVPVESAARVAGWIADLDADEFAVREQATRRLEELAESAIPSLEKALAGEPSPEARHRAEKLLRQMQEPVPGPRRLREIRALGVLEQIGTPEARRVLEKLSRVRRRQP